MSTLNIHRMTRRVDLFSLRLFLSVVEERQIRRAAVRERIAPSAATRRMHDLEEIAGMPLFDRKPSGLVASAAGEALARHLRGLFAGLETLRGELAELSESVQGKLVVATPTSLIVQYMARELGVFSRRQPLVKVELIQRLNPETARAVLTGEADLAVYLADPEIDETDLQVSPYRTARVVALVPLGHVLTQQSSATLADLLSQPFIGVSPETAMMSAAGAAARAQGLPFEPRFSVDSIEAARSLVEAGLGVSLQPESMLPPGAETRVAVLPLNEPWAVRQVHVASRRGSVPTPAARLLMQQLSGQIDQEIDVCSSDELTEVA